MLERLILRASLVIGILSFPFIFRNKFKELGIVFFSIGYIASFLANFVIVKGEWVRHPIRFLPQYFQTNVLYEYLILPLSCVLYNQTTSHSKLPGIIGQSILYSGFHTIIEYVLEKKTRLVIWVKWTWLHNMISLALTFIGSKGILMFFNRLSKGNE